VIIDSRYFMFFLYCFYITMKIIVEKYFEFEENNLRFEKNHEFVNSMTILLTYLSLL